MKAKIVTLMISAFMLVSLVLAFQIAPVGAQESITIDGAINEGEWDSYHLGTSITEWGGGMSVDVYGFADGIYLYVAYVADKEQLGWALAESLAVDCNFYTSTIEDSNLLDTIFQMWAPGESDQVQQTSDWVTWDDIGTLETAGVEYYYVSMWDPPNNQGVVEIKIPLSLVVIEGANQIELYGQYWQYDWGTLFYVELPPTEEDKLLAIITQKNEEIASLNKQIADKQNQIDELNRLSSTDVSTISRLQKERSELEKDRDYWKSLPRGGGPVVMHALSQEQNQQVVFAGAIGILGVAAMLCVKSFVGKSSKPKKLPR